MVQLNWYFVAQLFPDDVPVYLFDQNDKDHSYSEWAVGESEANIPRNLVPKTPVIKTLGEVRKAGVFHIFDPSLCGVRLAINVFHFNDAPPGETPRYATLSSS